MSKIKAALIVGAGLAGLYQMKKLSEVRGIRNNNAGNIRENQRVDYDWQGEALIDLDDEFEVFSDPRYGIRAMVKIFQSYARRGVVSVGDIVSTWAPPVENDTISYIRSVENQTGLSASDVLAPQNYLSFIKAIIKHENGIQPYSDDLINEAIAMA